MSSKFGLLGEKLGYSYSEEIHNNLFKILDKDAIYEKIEKKEDELFELVESMRDGLYNGINVTIPYKIKIMKYLDYVSPVAKRIGAVNTVIYKNGELHGDNTDYYGFLKTLEDNDIEIEGKKILILGTGGAAKSVYTVLTDLKAEKIFLASISQEKKIEIRKGDKIILYSDVSRLQHVDLIVNCTPVGMFPNIDCSPLKDSLQLTADYVIDLIYNPEETLLMKQFRLKGSKVINGLLMLVSQAIKSEEIWNKEVYDNEVITEIYNNISKKMYK